MVQGYPSLGEVDRISSYGWEYLCEADEACRQLVLGMVAEMYSANGVTAHLPESADRRPLDLVVSSHLIAINGREVTFVDAELRLGLLAHYVAESLLVPAWDDRPRFAETMRSVERREREFPGNAGLARMALVLLHNRYQRDILERAAAEADTEPHRFWQLYPALTQALPFLHTTVDVLARALASISKAIQGNLASRPMYDALEALSERQPEAARDLLCELVGAQAGPAAAFVPPLVKGLSKSHFRSAYAQAFELLHSEDPVLARYGVAALSHLDYSSAGREELFQEVLDHCASLRDRGSAAMVAAVAYAYGNLLPYGHRVQEALVELSARSETEIQYEVSRVLLFEVKEKSNEEWFRTALINLAIVKTEDRPTLDNLDGVLSSLARNDTRLPGCFLKKWIVSRVYGREEPGQGVEELFASTLSTLKTYQPGTLEEYITTWFSVDDPRLHRAARDIVEMLSARRCEAPRDGILLSRSILNCMNPEHVCFTIRKILGWVVDSQALTTLVFSAMQRRPEDQAVSDLVISAFVEYVAYNYPRPAISLLEERIEKGDEVEARVARVALPRIKSYYSSLRELPQVRELEPPTHRVRQLRRAQQKVFQGTVDAAQEKSVFLRLATRIPLKAGTFFFQQSHEMRAANKTPLSEFELTQDFPRGELIDPIGQEYLRLVWRTEAREAPK